MEEHEEQHISAKQKRKLQTDVVDEPEEDGKVCSLTSCLMHMPCVPDCVLPECFSAWLLLVLFV